jgi:predicted dehydrogenase
MLVTIIGSGNVATVMGKVLTEKGHVIAEVYSRDPIHAATLAKQLQANVVTDMETG